MRSAPNPSVVIVGSVGLDDLETPFGRETGCLGGSASYACVAASFFAPTGMVGVVGTDFPRRHLNRFRKRGIDLAGLQTVAGRTFRWSGVYATNLEDRRTLRTELNVFAGFQPELPPTFVRAPFVLLGNISPGLQLHVLDQIRSPRFVAADTMNLWIHTARKDLLRVMKRVDLLTLNESEAREYTGRRGLEAAAKRLLSFGPRWVLIKRGGAGSRLFGPGGGLLVPACPAPEVRDPTGAGDMYAGGFVGRLSREPRLDRPAMLRAMQAGSVVASLGIERFGLDAIWKIAPAALAGRIRAFQSLCGGRET
jgi:sugar/nucleoside kinase (ribokinase family)